MAAPARIDTSVVGLSGAAGSKPRAPRSALRNTRRLVGVSPATATTRSPPARCRSACARAASMAPTSSGPMALAGPASSARTRDVLRICSSSVATSAAMPAVTVPRRPGYDCVGVLLPPGATFDRYVIEGLLGEGGMGRVYSAYDPRLDRRVALKVLLAPHETRDGAATDGRTLDSEGSARLLREARAAAALDHPNAVSVFDVGEVGGVAFIAMELLEGRSLRTYVGDASVPVEQRLRWLVDVAHALGAAHHRGLVHRDIKPENVMIRGDGVAKVLDFGIARRIELQAVVGPVTPPDAARVATAPGTLVGTPLYMAPEQIRGDPVDGRTDQFAWGVVAFELLTGAPPWDTGGSGLRLVADILSKPAPELGSSEVSPAVEAAIRKALSKAPGDRFASMEELADAIAPRVTRPPHEPIAVDSRRSPLPPSLATTAPTPRPRRLLRVLGIMATAGALLVAVAWPSRHPARHAEETSTGKAPARAAPLA